MIQVNRIYLIFNRLVTKKFLVDTSDEFPQKRIAFVAPSYNSEKQAGSRLPDFRHTLYWNPEITSAMGTLNFYTSDMNGIYIITLQGISVDGREIRMQSEFVVGANH